MTIPTEVAAVLAEMREKGNMRWAAEIESALTKAEAVTWSAEDACEAFIAAEIDAAPEALRRLGEWLNQRMDEDDAKTASRMVLGAMMETSAAIRAVASNATGCCDGVCTGSCDGYPSTSNAHAPPAVPVESQHCPKCRFTMSGVGRCVNCEPAGSVPDGWRLVPIEPTEAMDSAAEVALCGSIGGYEHVCWRAAYNAAMLAAIPPTNQEGAAP